jgi:putative transcriptional regulator
MGFDLVARRDDTLLILKVLTNIDSISEDVAKELQTLSSLLHANPLLIGEKEGDGVLENDVVYFRFGIQAITLETFKNHLLEGIPVRIYAAPGGLYVNLDEKRLRRLRQERNLSLGTFARQLRVSRRTVQMYEDGMNARYEVASRMEEFLEDSITQPLDVFHHFIPEMDRVPRIFQNDEKIREFQQEVFYHLQKVGYQIIPLDRCPFEALSKDRRNLLLTCVQQYNSNLVKKAQIVSSISRITEKHAVVFTDKDIHQRNVEGTPIIIRKELKKVRDPEDIFTLILERI